MSWGNFWGNLDLGLLQRTWTAPHLQDIELLGHTKHDIPYISVNVLS